LRLERAWAEPSAPSSRADPPERFAAGRARSGSDRRRADAGGGGMATTTKRKLLERLRSGCLGTTLTDCGSARGGVILSLSRLCGRGAGVRFLVFRKAERPSPQPLSRKAGRGRTFQPKESR